MAESDESRRIVSIDGVSGIGGPRREIGSVSPEERDEIQKLFERRNGLLELAKTLATTPGLDFDNNPLYEKLTRDMGETSTKFQKWWDVRSKEYGWENLDGYQWEIDFETCKIFIKKQ